MVLSEQKCGANILKDQCERFSGRLVVIVKHTAVNPLFSLSRCFNLLPHSKDVHDGQTEERSLCFTNRETNCCSFPSRPTEKNSKGEKLH